MQPAGGAAMFTTPRRKSPLGPAITPLAAAGGQGAASFIRKGRNVPVFVVIASILLFALFMYSEDIKALAQYSFSGYENDRQSPPLDAQEEEEENGSGELREQESSAVEVPEGWNASVEAFVSVPSSCDLTKGYWAYDNVTRPLYREEQCAAMSLQMTCRKNGRKDNLYQMWRWQPFGCSLPRFDARLMLEKMRGKRLMFVGDSLNRNQWESLVCLLQTVVPRGKWRKKTNMGNRSVFSVKDYNASFEFYWAPFLVESNSDNPKIHSIDTRIVKADKIERHAVHWKDVDYLAFNTYIWWMNTPAMKVLRPDAKDWGEHDDVVRGEAYERVLRTWSTWVDANLDPRRTTVFFMSMSPLHLNSAAWGNPDGVKCAKEQLPIFNMTGVYLGTDMNLFRIAAAAVRSTARVAVDFVDITTMSDHRKDAHTQVYTVRKGKVLTPKQQADPATFADCIHWCLPGLPDTWNEILYAKILSAPPR